MQAASRSIRPSARSSFASRGRLVPISRRERNLPATARLSPASSIRSGRVSPAPVDDGSRGVQFPPRPVLRSWNVDVRVAGHQVDTGDSLREHAERRVAEITAKYFSRAVGANVTFGRGPNNDFTCDIVAPVVNGVVLKSTHSGREAEIAFN